MIGRSPLRRATGTTKSRERLAFSAAVCGMSHDAPARVGRSEDLGRARRWVDLGLGWSAVVPVALLAWAATAFPQGDGPAWVRTLAAIWSGALLAFFSGVRRGLSFSEASGARPAEIVTLLTLFVAGVLTLLFRSPALGAAGIALTAGVDALAARRREAPVYFGLFRPVQLGLAALGLAWVAWRTAGA